MLDVTERLTTLQARRVALAAQGFTRARPTTVGRPHLRSTLRRLGFFQIDSVNVLQRAHHLPLYSRCGPYDLELFHRAAGRSPRLMFEYWAHVATFVDVDLWPAMQHRMASRRGLWGGPDRIAREQPELVDAVLAHVAEHGPLTARQVDAALGEERERDRSHWGWNWTATKNALEFLFHGGRLTSARRTAQFEREYDLPERVIPADVLARPALDEAEAHRVMVEHAARAHGVATLPCLRDYFRSAPEPTRAAVEDLADAGVLLPVRVQGWDRPAWLHHEAARPRAVRARTLLSPFDPLVFERERTERLFGFRYRIEIYVPEAQREYGYYVLPFLLGDAIVARVDLKADRARGTLVVHGAWSEPGAPADTAVELAEELRTMARWLALGAIEVGERGDLAADVRTLV
ncbi:cytoplasmic protein [Aeromicrobium erythreum]|uniref:Cytoplasmic protein n=1 Tax=Aeromicrobium erythreum TaxID=2041 RepID=A0A0U3KGH5_9ACTN|nr:crosslink repair DNA glycosylase YcaQ family protein [Aeromicrobium erythreum]ALX04115.1 cytoplasmic protein [Aeromicrobium erythreum]